MLSLISPTILFTASGEIEDIKLDTEENTVHQGPVGSLMWSSITDGKPATTCTVCGAALQNGLEILTFTECKGTDAVRFSACNSHVQDLHWLSGIFWTQFKALVFICKALQYMAQVQVI